MLFEFINVRKDEISVIGPNGEKITFGPFERKMLDGWYKKYAPKTLRVLNPITIRTTRINTPTPKPKAQRQITPIIPQKVTFPEHPSIKFITTDQKVNEITKRLSILVLSIENRKPLLARLLNRLLPQLTSDVEVLITSDNVVSIGTKRNIALAAASGEYIAFVDDDDLVSENYVNKILRATELKPDCCGIEGIMTTDGKDPKTFIHSLKYDKWFTQNDVYYRCPNHLSPIKRDLARKVGFPTINHGEDKDYSVRILPLLETEVYIQDPIYYYLYIRKPKYK